MGGWAVLLLAQAQVGKGLHTGLDVAGGDHGNCSHLRLAAPSTHHQHQRPAHKPRTHNNAPTHPSMQATNDYKT